MMHAWFDGQLSADDARRVAESVARSAPLREEVAAWRAQRQGLRELAGVLPAPNDRWLAETLARLDVVDAAEGVDAIHAAGRSTTADDPLGSGKSAIAGDGPPAVSPLRWQRRWLPAFARAAAVVIVSAGSGWIAHDWWTGAGVGAARDVAAIDHRAPDASTPPGFAREAARAYAIYAPEVRHPVEVGADQHAHLVQWLSRRLGRPLRVPVLAEHGYQLLGGRLLPAADGASALFMYQRQDGQRLVLTMSALGAGREAADTAFRITQHGALSTFYWIDRDFGYALSGELPQQTMAAIARSVYTQTIENAASPGDAPPRN